MLGWSVRTTFKRHQFSVRSFRTPSEQQDTPAPFSNFLSRVVPSWPNLLCRILCGRGGPFRWRVCSREGTSQPRRANPRPREEVAHAALFTETIQKLLNGTSPCPKSGQLALTRKHMPASSAMLSCRTLKVGMDYAHWDEG